MLMTVNFRESELAWGSQPAGDSLTPIYHHRRSRFMSVVTSVNELQRESLKYRQNKNFVSSFIFYAFDSRHKLYENVDGEPTCMYYNSWPSPTLSMTFLHLCQCPEHACFLLHSVRMQVSSKVKGKNLTHSGQQTGNQHIYRCFCNILKFIHSPWMTLMWESNINLMQDQSEWTTLVALTLRWNARERENLSLSEFIAASWS